jgi:hypothetical protein
VYRKRKNVRERILMFTAGVSQYFSVGISGLREIDEESMNVEGKVC